MSAEGSSGSSDLISAPRSASNDFKDINAAVRDVITLFHSPASQASIRAHTLLKQTAAAAQSTATIDQAGDHAQQSKTERTNFELEVTEDAPTGDQLRSMLDYLGSGGVVKVVKGASNQAEALKKVQEDGSNFIRPVVVDWNNGRAVAGDNQSEILELLKKKA
ncbi:hypothetical protein B0A49_03946 [Cryomyces minteri]|uniref:Glutaredoxin domain-containing protein n=1 Tax=Cryomyces minteri TaxID=331657 RepID=A0A4U0XFG4_9PEZI|nr:hypothetical protein B0A49_03946 [Cryomyces minteri]